jgi:uncharacterized protein YndB with AHSA1/START domain
MNPPTAPKALQISTPTDTTIVLTRTFNAPPRLVWQAFFVPDKMRRWMLPPPGLTLTVCECDARVGGALRLAWKNEEADPFMTLQGEFTEAAPHQRATHTERMALGSGQTIGSQLETHEFAEKQGMPGITQMRITQTYDSKEARDGALASGMDEGMEACYKQLDTLFAPPT